MIIEESFPVAAAPDRVFEYLLNVEQVIGCMPGAELVEMLDDDTFKGRLKIKVGPVVTKYEGTARVISRDLDNHRATLSASAQEMVGAGSAKATISMAVDQQGDGALVHLKTDYSVAGRVAQFGRGVIEDVSRRLIAQMAGCIRTRLEQPADALMAATPSADPSAAGPLSTTSAPASAAAAPAPNPTAQLAAPEELNALSLLLGVLLDRVRRLARGRRAGAREDPEARLATLQRLKDKGLVSEEEYHNVRRRVLDSL